GDWDRCPQGQVLTMDLGNGETRQYEAGELIAGENRIGNTITRLDPPPRSCHKVMAAQSNVLVETTVCGTGDVTSQANEIADQILAKVPR
ncbi:sensor domain-containing protein, partial [Mycobacterium sp.]|uniref:sensor domain-containing protein n=1 Tax=Mycobacterium sp. TaxID=1785 RepID=UPI002D8C0A6A|nr:sensor domain-containing protein [Mycobacterium sp.]